MMPEGMVPPPINNLNELVEPQLNGSKIISHESYFFTEPGDNYGSTLLGVKTKVKDPDNKISDLDLVVKLLPQHEMLIAIFQPERTFRTENNCYTIVAPAFIKLQKEANIPDDKITNVFAKCYGARISLDKNAQKVDTDAALVLENLCNSGYKMGDRYKGFDYETTLVILRDLARFHAMPIVLRRLNPSKFGKTYRPFLKPFHCELGIEENMRKHMDEDNLNIIRKIPNLSHDLLDKVIKAFNLHEERINNLKKCPDTLFSTITHNDFWVNNIMILHDEEGKPRSIKIVDFQVAQYDSLMVDLVFFLFLNVEMNTLKEKFDDLLQQYYDYFIQCFDELGCSTEEYNYEKFLDEFRRIGPQEFHHVIGMTKVLTVKKESIPQLENFKNLEDIANEFKFSEDSLISGFFEKLKETIYLFQEKKLL